MRTQERTSGAQSPGRLGGQEVGGSNPLGPTGKTAGQGPFFGVAPAAWRAEVATGLLPGTVRAGRWTCPRTSMLAFMGGLRAREARPHPRPHHVCGEPCHVRKRGAGRGALQTLRGRPIRLEPSRLAGRATGKHPASSSRAQAQPLPSPWLRGRVADLTWGSGRLPGQSAGGGRLRFLPFPDRVALHGLGMEIQFPQHTRRTAPQVSQPNHGRFLPVTEGGRHERF